MINDILDKIDFNITSIIDNYQLKDGLYVKVGNEKIEFFIYKRDKNKDKRFCLKDLDGKIRDDEYDYFAIRDYLSNYLNSNKSIDPPKKKIHNNNYLTLFVKAREFNEANKKHFLENLYDKLKTFDSFNKKEEKEVIDSFRDYIKSREDDVEKKKKRFEEIFDQILEKKSLVKDNEYIKIFFDEDVEKYEKEASIYYALKIYNKIETIRKIDGEIYGLSDFNMGLNRKKPYLEHKTRGFPFPFMVKKDEIFRYKQLFDLLKYQQSYIKINKKNNKSGILIVKHSNNDQVEIIDFDILPVEEKLAKRFVFKNSLFKKKDDEIVYSFEELFSLIDRVFFNELLVNNLYNDVYSKLDKEIQNLIYLTRDLLKSLRNGNLEALFVFNKKFANKFIEYYIKKGNEFKAKEVLNLYLAILEYKGESVNIKEVLKRIEEKIKNLDELNSDEFFVLSGQIIKYLLDKNKKSEKKADLYEPFLRANKVKKLKNEIETLFFLYKHEINLNFKKFNNALALIEAYDKDEKVKKDMLLVGILVDNIFYKKDDK